MQLEINMEEVERLVDGVSKAKITENKPAL
jgi:hypothetical protein